ncbi:VCBS repeat-containing protein [Stenotrophomonas sp.]|uniref:FG-GAP repeat domain-containing protein n=1 Tax=Stenotrophomonas sp. TaxID=69392 RepID=UPI002FCB13A9
MASAPGAPTAQQALRAAQASLKRLPADDIQHSYRPLAVRVADLDGDGHAEIVYVYTGTFNGGAFERSNALVVMTRLAMNDARGHAPASASRVDQQDAAAIRAAGYADDVAVHVPGAFKRLAVEGQDIRVTFQAERGSDYCRAQDRTHKQRPCPPPGEHTWQWRWTPGALVQVMPTGRA